MKRSLMILSVFVSACASDLRPFPVKNPMWKDYDLTSVNVACRDEHGKRVCAPKPYKSPLYWDGVDGIVFRPLSEAFGIRTSGEAIDVNSMDEVPDSSWFQNRIGLGWMTAEDVRRGPCKPEQILDPDAWPDGSWVIDKGKDDGSTGGFRILVPGKGKYLVKTEDAHDHPERQAAASVIGANVYWAAGYFSVCEQALYIRPSLLKLTPNLVTRGNFQPDKPFDQKALDTLLEKSTHKGKLIRVSASAWAPGRILGPHRYVGTRKDDPNDVVPHEDRRELRGMRLLAAWIDRFDAREANSIDTWIADDKKHPDSSPGHVVHWQLDASECLGGDWSAVGFDEMSRRLGSSYLVDWGDVAVDFATLGIPLRPWDRVRSVPGHELFGMFNVKDFDPEKWKNEYQNEAFVRMSERDGAWMARILARFTPEMLHALAEAGKFSDASNTTYLTSVLEGRLDKVLDRYLLRLSPITDVHMDQSGELCALDLAAWRGVRDASSFHYDARTLSGAPLVVTKRSGPGEICVEVERAQNDSPYVVVTLEDGVARGKLFVHLYDLGPQGFKVVGVERPKP